MFPNIQIQFAVSGFALYVSGDLRGDYFALLPDISKRHSRRMDLYRLHALEISQLWKLSTAANEGVDHCHRIDTHKWTVYTPKLKVLWGFSIQTENTHMHSLLSLFTSKFCKGYHTVEKGINMAD